MERKDEKRNQVKMLTLKPPSLEAAATTDSADSAGSHESHYTSLIVPVCSHLSPLRQIKNPSMNKMYIQSHVDNDKLQFFCITQTVILHRSVNDCGGSGSAVLTREMRVTWVVCNNLCLHFSALPYDQYWACSLLQKHPLKKALTIAQ